MIKVVVLCDDVLYSEEFKAIPNLTLRAIDELHLKNIKVAGNIECDKLDYKIDEINNIDSDEILILDKSKLKKSIEDGGVYEALIDIGILQKKKYDSKIFFFDIDSTTFDHSVDEVRESTYEALQKLKDNGYKICINTSRSYEEMFNVPKKLMDMMDCIVLLSGAYIIKDGKTYIKYLDENECKKAIKYFDEHNMIYRYATGDGRGYLSVDNEYSNSIFYSLYNMIPEVKKYDGEKVTHILFYSTDERRDEIAGMISKCEYSPISTGGELYPENTSKGYAILEVAKMYGFTREETCAFGDGGNDCTMLQMAGLGVAMGNSVDICKQSADYVTDDISLEGLYNAMKHFGFID